MDRRPIPQRESGWARKIARALARAGFSPNGISVASVVVAAGAAAAVASATRTEGAVAVALFLAAGVLMEVRLLCNLFDGMLAVEHAMQSKVGVIYNDLPDRISDVLIFVGMGYAITRWGWGPELGWLAAVAAVGTAYVRLLGGAAGVQQDFGGPMAKQLRMHVGVAGVVVAAALISSEERSQGALAAALAVIAAGSLFTVARRTVSTARRLEAK